MSFDLAWSEFGFRLATGAFRICVILFLTFIAMVIIRRYSGKMGVFLTWGKSENAEIKKRANTLTSFIRYFLVFLVGAISGLMVLKELGVEIGPILASAGVLGIAIGFGAQNLVQDIISGFFILMEDQIRVGDVVNVKGKGGLVEKVGLRMIILRDLDGTVHFIRNGQIDIVSNMTKQFANYVFDLRIPYGYDPEEVKRIFRVVDEEMRNDAKFGPDILRPMDVFGIDQLAESWMVLRARTTTKPLRQWDVGREFLRRIKNRLDEAGIPLASPRIQVAVAGTEAHSVGNDHQGNGSYGRG